MESNSGDSSGFAGTQFYIGGSSNRKLYPQTVNDVRLRAGVTVREKRSYLEFPSTSGFGEVLPRILGDPAVTWHSQILSRKNFLIFPGQNLISIWQLLSRLKSIFANSRIPIANFRILRSASFQISYFQNLEFSRDRQFLINFEVKFKSSYSSS